MEITSALWLSELGMEDPDFNYYPHHLSTLDYPIDDLDFDSSFSSKKLVDQTFNSQTLNCPTPIINDQLQESQTLTLERPKKQHKTNSWSSCTTHHDPIITSTTTTPIPTTTPSSSHIISFDKSSSLKRASPASYQQLYGTIKPENEVEYSNILDKQFCSGYYAQGSKKVAAGGGSGRSPSHAQDHVLAERKRREKLRQGFIALSSVVPGLKKMDKTSVLVEAIKYLKHMQDRVKTLEEQAAKRTMESVVFVKKSQVYADDELSSSEENSDGFCDQTLPEIKARVSDNNVLIRIHCENQKGSVQKILNQVEKLPLNVINTSVLPFGNSTLDVTIVAQVEGELSMTVKDVLKNIRQGLM